MTAASDASKEKKPLLAIEQPNRWKKWLIRTVTTWLLVGGFFLVVRQGVLVLALCLLSLQLVVRVAERSLNGLTNIVPGVQGGYCYWLCVGEGERTTTLPRAAVV